MGLFDEDVCETKEVAEEWEGGIVGGELRREVDSLLWDGFIHSRGLERVNGEIEWTYLVGLSIG